MNKIYLTTEEWKQTKDVSDQLNSLLREIGRKNLILVQTKKEVEEMVNQYEAINERNIPLYNSILEKYGKGEIDTEHGVFIKKEQ